MVKPDVFSLMYAWQYKSCSQWMLRSSIKHILSSSIIVWILNDVSYLISPYHHQRLTGSFHRRYEHMWRKEQHLTFFINNCLGSSFNNTYLLVWSCTHLRHVMLSFKQYILHVISNLILAVGAFGVTEDCTDIFIWQAKYPYWCYWLSLGNTAHINN